MDGKIKQWYSIKKASPFGVDPFGTGELSDKVRTQPYGNVGGDSKTGLFEPSSGKGHANDYFSESDNTKNIEKRLEELKEKRKKRKNKSIKNKSKKIAQWGVSGPRLPFWNYENFTNKSYEENSKNIQNKFKKNKVKKTGLDGDIEINDNEENQYKKILKSSVTIKTKDNNLSEIGSGFFINEAMILTCLHVASPSGNIDGSEIEVKTNDGTYSARILAYDEDIDTAVLILENEYSSKEYLPICSMELEQGEEIIVVGTPLGFENIVGDGIISSGGSHIMEDGSEYFFISANIEPGNSGGPIVCKNKNAVVGMAAALITREESSTGLSAAISAENIKEFLNENGIKYTEV